MLARLAAFVVWMTCVLCLGGWVAVSIYRGHLAPMVITTTALALTIVVPVLGLHLRNGGE